MTDLIPKLEAAPEGSRELSDEVLLAFGWTHDGEYWLDANNTNRCKFDAALDPTRSIDDIVALVPEGWFGEIRFGKIAWAWLRLGEGDLIRAYDIATPALALCIACLEAQEHSDA